MSVGLNKSEIEQIMVKELSNSTLSDTDIQKIVIAITTVIIENNKQIDKQLSEIRNMVY